MPRERATAVRSPPASAIARASAGIGPRQPPSAPAAGSKKRSCKNEPFSPLWVSDKGSIFFFFLQLQIFHAVAGGDFRRRPLLLPPAAEGRGEGESDRGDGARSKIIGILGCSEDGRNLRLRVSSTHPPFLASFTFIPFEMFTVEDLKSGCEKRIH